MPQGTIDAFGWALVKKKDKLSADKLLVAATAAKARSASSDEDAALEKVGIKRTLNKGRGDCGYYALADGLREIAGIVVTADELRAEALVEMRANASEYAHGAGCGALAQLGSNALVVDSIAWSAYCANAAKRGVDITNVEWAALRKIYIGVVDIVFLKTAQDFGRLKVVQAHFCSETDSAAATALSVGSCVTAAIVKSLPANALVIYYSPSGASGHHEYGQRIDVVVEAAAEEEAEDEAGGEVFEVKEEEEEVRQRAAHTRALSAHARNSSPRALALTRPTRARPSFLPAPSPRSPTRRRTTTIRARARVTTGWSRMIWQTMKRVRRKQHESQGAEVYII